MHVEIERDLRVWLERQVRLARDARYVEAARGRPLQHAVHVCRWARTGWIDLEVACRKIDVAFEEQRRASVHGRDRCYRGVVSGTKPNRIGTIIGDRFRLD